MVNPQGVRRGTRYMFSKDFKKHGIEPLSTYYRPYKRGDIVDIKANGAFQKGMPFKAYHGKTGRVFNVTKHAVGVVVNKRVRQRVMHKHLNIRIEHIKPSKCRKDFLDRVKANDVKRREAKAQGVKVDLKRMPVEPRKGHLIVTSADYTPQLLAPVKFEIIA
uniref:Large ribosomal subunit protein eL21 n=1 Tax=Steinernema glaseri TaxID=37863 RepID=A0A1I7ZAX7_9BILA